MSKQGLDKPLRQLPIPLSGKCRTSVDPAQLAEGEFQQLTNMRYGQVSPKSIGGMTKINSTPLTKPKVRAGIHFKKDQPAESHVLVQGFNTGETASSVYDNTTAIPNTGEFGASIWDDASGAGYGRFSLAPDASMCYCNGAETLLWGGNESRCASFLVGDSQVNISFDYTSKINNTMSDATNVATINHLAINMGSSTNIGNMTGGGGLAAAYDGVTSTVAASCARIIGTGVLTGTVGKNWGSGVANIISAFKLYGSSEAGLANDAYGNPESETLTVKLQGSTDNFSLSVVDLYTNATVANVNGLALNVTSGITTTTAYQYHRLLILENTGDGGNHSLNVAEVIFYSPCTVYIASTKPIKGGKFYVGTANTTAGTASVNYWANSQWTAATNMVDGTATAGVTLAKTGEISFDSTVSTAKIRYLDNTVAYWYQFIFSVVSDSTTIYYCTLDAPMQPILDIWDGITRNITSYQTYTSQYNDYTTNVLKDDYVAGASETYVSLGGLTSSQFQVVGFVERMTALKFKLISGYVNTNAVTASVYYWDGTTWATVGTINDDTLSNSASFNRGGVISWDAPAENTEFETTISSDKYYFYKIVFSGTLSANVYLDYIEGIPVQTPISKYKFSVLYQNRLLLLNDQKQLKNSILLGGYNTNCVFNGTDSTTLYFGDSTEIQAAASLFSRFGGTIYENLIVSKYDSTYLLDGTSPSNYAIYKISTTYGCAAPQTMTVCDVGYEVSPGITKHVAIWQAATGVVMFDGNSIIPIHYDIENYFDQAKSERINPAMINKSIGWYDEVNREYHWKFASGSNTTLDQEWIYNLIQKAWSNVDRGASSIQYALQVIDTIGNKHNYGTLDTGYMERLENGTTFDGVAITSTFWTGDIAIKGWMQETQKRFIKLMAKTKSNTTNSVTMTHYGDCATSSSETITIPVSASHADNSGKRVTNTPKSVNWGNSTYHSFKCSLVTTNEAQGFEPVGIGILYKETRQDIE